jgi:hypothetical protein
MVGTQLKAWWDSWLKVEQGSWWAKEGAPELKGRKGMFAWTVSLSNNQPIVSRWEHGMWEVQASKLAVEMIAARDTAINSTQQGEGCWNNRLKLLILELLWAFGFDWSRLKMGAKPAPKDPGFGPGVCRSHLEHQGCSTIYPWHCYLAKIARIPVDWLVRAFSP